MFRLLFSIALSIASSNEFSVDMTAALLEDQNLLKIRLIKEYD